MQTNVKKYFIVVNSPQPRGTKHNRCFLVAQIASQNQHSVFTHKPRHVPSVTKCYFCYNDSCCFLCADSINRELLFLQPGLSLPVLVLTQKLPSEAYWPWSLLQPDCSKFKNELSASLSSASLFPFCRMHRSDFCTAAGKEQKQLSRTSKRSLDMLVSSHSALTQTAARYLFGDRHCLQTSRYIYIES